ncbi:MAG: dephospho-CoA kinase [Candidatus Acidulodesulfobacterium acidiphilum]|uniref:Dephospho-CoA kinase n=1 Tax=Candidatus Acidulodesulfobacterium acidiphilum TaxID=2597224 RepID=A0A520XED0_9DELT|nr:MAG: dephospho-CoA kinase [Candidatus Acidulodesulfobacterium acidiphilum]
MIKIGLTGSIGSGKTAVLNLFKDFGFLTVNLDEEAKKIYKKNSFEYKKIVDFFGNKILNKDYDIDRKILAGIIFSDISKKKILEDIVYPALRKNIEVFLAESGKSAAVIEGAVIIESGYYKNLDKLVVVTCDFSKRLMRSYKKFDIEDFVKRDENQLNQKGKIKKSDFIINNNFGFNFLIPQIEYFVKFLKNIYGDKLKSISINIPVSNKI